MIRDPLSSVCKNGQTGKSFKCSALAFAETMPKWSAEFEGRRPKRFSCALTHLPTLCPPFSLQPLCVHGALHSTVNILKVIISCAALLASRWDLQACSFWWSDFHVYEMRWEHGHFKASEMDIQHWDAKGGQRNQHENVILTPWQEWEPSHKCLFRGRGMA